MESIKLDILPGAMPPIVHASQGDIGRQFKIGIYNEDGTSYSLTGKTLSIVGHKQDGHVFQYSIPSSAISNNEVTITTEEQMTTTAGKTLCEITIESEGVKLGTANFILQIEQGPADLGSLSTSALYIIQALFNTAKENVEIATESANIATEKANSATQSANIATEKANSATQSATSALNSANTATEKANSATQSATSASNSANSAQISETNASTSETNANTYATNALNSANNASESETNAKNSEELAEQYMEAAQASATSASLSASTSQQYATASSNSADSAENYAESAELSAQSASTSETNAYNYASNASVSASNAHTSEDNAEISATNAETFASAAESALQGLEDMTVVAHTLPTGVEATVTKSSVGGVTQLDFGLPRGEKGSGPGTEVIPNPESGIPAGELSSIGIDGYNYQLPGARELAEVAYSGSYNDLDDKPTIPDEQVNADWNATSGKAQILNKPTIPDEQVNADWNATSGKAQILNKPTIPEEQIQSDWNQSNTSAKDFIKNKPTIPAEQIQSDWNQSNSSSKDFIKNKPTIPAEQVNADWNATSGKSQILNKPTVGSATINILQGGVSKGSFNLNDTENKQINLDAGGGAKVKTINCMDISYSSATNYAAITKDVYTIDEVLANVTLQNIFCDRKSFCTFLTNNKSAQTKAKVVQSKYLTHMIDYDNNKYNAIEHALKYIYGYTTNTPTLVEVYPSAAFNVNANTSLLLVKPLYNGSSSGKTPVNIPSGLILVNTSLQTNIAQVINDIGTTGSALNVFNFNSSAWNDQNSMLVTGYVPTYERNDDSTNPYKYSTINGILLGVHYSFKTSISSKCRILSSATEICRYSALVSLRDGWRVSSVEYGYYKGTSIPANPSYTWATPSSGVGNYIRNITMPYANSMIALKVRVKITNGTTEETLTQPYPFVLSVYA